MFAWMLAAAVFWAAGGEPPAGHAGPPGAAQPSARDDVDEMPALLDSTQRALPFTRAWRTLGTAENRCKPADLGYDYWPHGGIRNFWCRAQSVLPWAAVTKLAPAKIWLRGPHGEWLGGKLDLHNPHDFGRYNPAFVRWFVDNAVPASQNEQLRFATQPAYDEYVRELAHTYFAVHEKMQANPKWVKRERDLYLRTMDEKNPNWAAFYDKFSSFLGANGLAARAGGTFGFDWGGYDPNLQSAAVAFWLRRDVDKTAPLFFEGLTKLLKTYDAAWLAHPTKAADRQ